MNDVLIRVPITPDALTKPAVCCPPHRWIYQEGRDTVSQELTGRTQQHVKSLSEKRYRCAWCDAEKVYSESLGVVRQSFGAIGRIGKTVHRAKVK